MTTHTRGDWLGSGGARHFLRRYWHKRPLFLPAAFAEFECPVTKAALLELARSPEVESRLVQEHGAHPFQLRRGPIASRAVRALPSTHWTLLVQDVDKHLPAVAALLDHFSFLPHWRIDDIMISYAAPGGSVGPHFDNYDVFLLQGQGHRRWRIGPRPAHPQFLPDSELQVLQNFSSQREIVAGPGDVLYLPPQLAHHGVAEDECITLSVGFRAPSQRELAFAFAEELLAGSSDELRYSDPDVRLQDSPGAIDPRAFARVRKLLSGALRPGQSQMERWFARYVTEPKPHLVRERTASGLSKARLRTALRRGATLEHALGTRWAYFSSGKAWLYVDGEEWQLPTRLLPLVKRLCDAPQVAAAQIEPLLARAGSDTLLHELVQRGLLVVSRRDATRRKR